MELIYIYIQNYRTFKEKKVSFSNKFIVDYNENSLNIRRNTDFIDIYPSNIVGINAIIGKNATGKTSLLSLIGDKINTRIKNNEVWEEDKRDPHKQVLYDLSQIESQSGNIESIVYKAVYFLLYYNGKDGSGNDLFVFETNNPNKFVKIFDNYTSLITNNGDGTSYLDYYTSKGWFSYVFISDNYKNTLFNNVQQYITNKTNSSIYNLKKLTTITTSSIIYFKKNHRSNSYHIVSEIEEEHTISIKRRYSSIQNLCLYNQLKFLIEQMNNNNHNSVLYSDKFYKLNICFSDSYISSPKNEPELDVMEVVKDYREFSLDNFSKQQKIILSFICKYAQYRLSTFVYSSGEISEKQKSCIQALQRITTSSYTFNGIKKYYYELIIIIIEFINIEENLFEDFKIALKSFEEFFEKEEEHNISYTYKESMLILELNKNSKIEIIQPFFCNFLDEPNRKMLDESPSVFDNFIKADIAWLSDGEKENLSLFTEISEQITVHHEDKKNYILLFDEIERTMHPEMCRHFISDLINFLNAYPEKKFQIIISSHSPFIISDIRKENILLLSKEDENTSITQIKENTLGQNIHNILKNSFFLDNTFG